MIHKIISMVVTPLPWPLSPNQAPWLEWLEITGNGCNDWRLLEMAGHDQTWKWQEIYADGQHMLEGLGIAENAYGSLEQMEMA